MNQNLHNFEHWFKGVLQGLFSDANGGFAILMISLPLIERYLREKSGVAEGRLTPVFYREMLACFPTLNDVRTAEKFWQTYRNGLVHQATLSRRNTNDVQMPDGWLSGNAGVIDVDSATGIWVNPTKFAERVLQIIQADFVTFEGASSSNHPLPAVVVSSSGTTNAPFPLTAPPTGSANP